MSRRTQTKNSHTPVSISAGFFLRSDNVVFLSGESLRHSANSVERTSIEKNQSDGAAETRYQKIRSNVSNYAFTRYVSTRIDTVRSVLSKLAET